MKQRSLVTISSKNMEKNKYDVVLRSDINYSLKWLLFMGWWPPEGNVSIWLKIFYQIYRIPLVIMLFTYIGQEFTNIMNSFETLEKGIASSVIFFGHAMELVKLFFMVKNRDKIIDLMEYLNDDIFKPKNDDEHKILKDSMGRSLYFAKMYIVNAAVAVSGWVFGAIIQGKYNLPADVWFPYDTGVPIVYELTFIYETFVLYVSGTLYAVTDCVIAGILAHVSTQFVILNDKASKIYENTMTLAENSKGDDNFNFDVAIYENLKSCVFHHQAITKYAIIQVNSLVTNQKAGLT